MNARQRKKKAKKDSAARAARRRLEKAIKLGEWYSVGPKRFQSAAQIQTLPRDFVAVGGVDYGTVEKTIMTVYPGADGIGPDIVERVTKEAHVRMMAEHERKVAAAFGIPPETLNRKA